MKTYFVIANLIGLCVEIVGAFFLSAEAIGLRRIQSWRKRYFENASYVASTYSIEERSKRAAEVSLGALPLVLSLIGSSLGAFLGTWIALTIDALQFSWLPKRLGIAVGVLVGAVGGVYTLVTIAFLFRASSSILIWLESRTQQGAIGLIGFFLLLTGFVLQIIGALSGFF